MKKIILICLILLNFNLSANALTSIKYSNTGVPMYATNSLGQRIPLNNFNNNSLYKMNPLRYNPPYYNKYPAYNYYNRPYYGYPYNHYNPYYRYDNRYIPPFAAYPYHTPYLPYGYYRPSVIEKTLYRKMLAQYQNNMLSSYYNETQPISRLHKDYRVSPPQKTAYCNGITYYGGTNPCQ